MVRYLDWCKKSDWIEVFIVYCGFSPKSTPKYPPGKGQDPPIKRGPRTFAPFFWGMPQKKEQLASKKGATCLKKRSNFQLDEHKNHHQKMTSTSLVTSYPHPPNCWTTKETILGHHTRQHHITYINKLQHIEHHHQHNTSLPQDHTRSHVHKYIHS